MKVIVELTKKGEAVSTTGRKAGLVGRLVSATPSKDTNGIYEIETVNVQWPDGSFGRYNVADKYIRIIGFSNY